jgi:hypothetical protein
MYHKSISMLPEYAKSRWQRSSGLRFVTVSTLLDANEPDFTESVTSEQAPVGEGQTKPPPPWVFVKTKLERRKYQIFKNYFKNIILSPMSDQ